MKVLSKAFLTKCTKQIVIQQKQKYLLHRMSCVESFTQMKCKYAQKSKKINQSLL